MDVIFLYVDCYFVLNQIYSLYTPSSNDARNPFL